MFFNIRFYFMIIVMFLFESLLSLYKKGFVKLWKSSDYFKYWGEFLFEIMNISFRWEFYLWFCMDFDLIKYYWNVMFSGKVWMWNVFGKLNRYSMNYVFLKYLIFKCNII